MMRSLKIVTLLGLWAFWFYLFVNVTLVGYALTGSLWKAVVPDLPIAEYGLPGALEWVAAVILFYGTPILLGIVSWRLLKSRRNRKIENA